MSDFDTFISFSSVDLSKARFIQRFLESWVDKRSGRRLRVFRDETDLRGGCLDDALRDAAHAARTLVVCHSPAAAESRWVQAEIGLFSGKDQGGRIAVAIVGGSQTAPEVGRTAVPGTEVRVHDLRRGLWLARFGLGAKVELLRLLAFVADVDMRTLRNWYLRRTIRNVAAFVVLALVPLLAILSLSLPDWHQVALRQGDAPLYAIAAEVQGDKLLVASRFRAAGPQGFRDYIRVTRDALGAHPESTLDEVALQRRLLPLRQLPFDWQRQVPRIDPGSLTSRPPVGDRWFCELADGRSIVLQPLAPTEAEDNEARDLEADLGTPVPTVVGSLVATSDRGQRAAAVIADLSPVWDETEGIRGPSSPARGLAVAWSPEGEVWIGMEGRDAREAGGLWRRRAGQTEWTKEPGFLSVQSIDLDVQGGTTRRVWVTERHLERWRGAVLEPSPTRVLMLERGATDWVPAPAPPFGARSEVELVGKLDGARLVRVDEHLFREQSIRLWRFLLSRSMRR